MHTLSLVASALVVATSTGAAESIIFHTARFADAKATSLSLLSNTLSKDKAYDFDVLIGLTETDRNGVVVYVDTTRHPARVKCGTPAKVFVGGVDYPVDGLSNRPKENDWKQDLWRAVCIAYVS